MDALFDNAHLRVVIAIWNWNWAEFNLQIYSKLANLFLRVFSFSVAIRKKKKHRANISDCGMESKIL